MTNETLINELRARAAYELQCCGLCPAETRCRHCSAAALLEQAAAALGAKPESEPFAAIELLRTHVLDYAEAVDGPSDEATASARAALDLLAEALSRPAEGWQDIASYGLNPIDPTPVVLRPHRIHGVMDVRRLTDAERAAWKAADGGVLSRDIDWQWVNGDLTTMWTETAFWPFWMPLPAPPLVLIETKGQDHEPA